MRKALEKAIFRKIMRVKVFGTKTSESSIGFKKRGSKPVANTTKERKQASK